MTLSEHSLTYICGIDDDIVNSVENRLIGANCGIVVNIDRYLYKAKDNNQRKKCLSNALSRVAKLLDRSDVILVGNLEDADIRLVDSYLGFYKQSQIFLDRDNEATEFGICLGTSLYITQYPFKNLYNVVAKAQQNAKRKWKIC